MINLEDINIQKILPQSAPFIMIDRIIDYQEGQSLTAVKNVTGSEWFFAEPSPAEPMLPDVLLIEGAAQTAIVFSVLEDGKVGEGSRPVALGKISAEFQAPVRIGGRVKFTTTNFKVMRDRGFVDVIVKIEEKEIGSVSVFYSFMMGAGHD